MFNAIFSSFLLLIPGVIAAELTFYLKPVKIRKLLDLISLSLIYAFVILLSNALVKTLLGGANEFFMITATQFLTISLVKYLGLSIVFALIYPYIAVMADILIRSKKSSHGQS